MTFRQINSFLTPQRFATRMGQGDSHADLFRLFFLYNSTDITVLKTNGFTDLHVIKNFWDRAADGYGMEFSLLIHERIMARLVALSKQQDIIGLHLDGTGFARKKSISSQSYMREPDQGISFKNTDTKKCKFIVHLLCFQISSTLNSVLNIKQLK